MIITTTVAVVVIVVVVVITIIIKNILGFLPFISGRDIHTRLKNHKWT